MATGSTYAADVDCFFIRDRLDQLRLRSSLTIYLRLCSLFTVFFSLLHNFHSALESKIKITLCLAEGI